MEGLIILISTSFFLIIIYIKNTKTLLSPPVAVLFSLLLTGILVFIMLVSNDSFGYELKLDSLNQTSGLYILGMVSFLLPWAKELFFSKNELINSIKAELTRVQKISLYITFTLSVLICALLIYLQKGILILNIYSKILTIQDSKETYFDLPPGLLLLNTVIPLVFSQYFAHIIMGFRAMDFFGKLIASFMFLFAVFVSIYQGTRQSLLIFVFTIFSVILLNSRRINLILISVLTILFLSLFISIRQIRSSDNLLFREIALYQTLSFWNMNSIVNSYEPIGEINKITSELTFGRENAISLEKNKQYLMEPSAPAGYISFFYMDFGGFGVFFGSLIFGMVSRFLFFKRYNNLSWQASYIVCLYACFTFVTYSHFVTLVFFVAPIFLLFLLNLFEKTLTGVIGRKVLVASR